MSNSAALDIVIGLCVILSFFVILGIYRISQAFREGDRYKTELMTWRTVQIAVIDAGCIYAAFGPWDLHKAIALTVFSMVASVISLARHVRLDGRTPAEMSKRGMDGDETVGN